MKIIITFSILLGTLQASECWKITSNDEKRLCESRFENKQNCWLIKDQDRMNYCKATAEGKDTCWLIKDNNLRYSCKSETGQ